MFHFTLDRVKRQLRLITINELINQNVFNYLDGVGETHQYLLTSMTLIPSCINYYSPNDYNDLMKLVSND